MGTPDPVSGLLQGRNIIVFYGSQTGTAEEFANRLSKDAHRYGMRGMAADPEEYDLVSAHHAGPGRLAGRARGATGNSSPGGCLHPCRPT